LSQGGKGGRTLARVPRHVYLLWLFALVLLGAIVAVKALEVIQHYWV
jgi:hypothetical protein